MWRPLTRRFALALAAFLIFAFVAVGKLAELQLELRAQEQRTRIELLSERINGLIEETQDYQVQASRERTLIAARLEELLSRIPAKAPAGGEGR